MVVQELYLLLVVYLEVIMLERYQWLPADIVAAIGATFVTNATNATNATNTVNVGVTNDAATYSGIFLSWVSAASGNQPTKVSSALFLLLVFYQQQDSQEMVLHISYSS
jgi:hypothetical protein